MRVEEIVKEKTRMDEKSLFSGGLSAKILQSGCKKNTEANLCGSKGVLSYDSRSRDSAFNSDLSVLKKFYSEKFCEKFLRKLENVDFKNHGSKLVTELLRV